MKGSKRKLPTFIQKEWETFDRTTPIERLPDPLPPPPLSFTWTPSDRPRGKGPADFSHRERDAMGHFASRLREDQSKARRRPSHAIWFDVRQSDIDKVLKIRLGPRGMIPEGIDDAEQIILVMAYHLQARLDGDPDGLLPKLLTNWCLKFCENWKKGWPTKGDIFRRILPAVQGRRRDLTAIQSGLLLKLTWDERCLLGVRTIRPWDLTPAQFRAAAKERARKMNRDREEARRRKNGSVPRAEYLAAAAKRKAERDAACAELGCSPATLYRRQAAAAARGEKGPCEIEGTPINTHGPFSDPQTVLGRPKARLSIRRGTFVSVSVLGSGKSGTYQLATLDGPEDGTAKLKGRGAR